MQEIRPFNLALLIWYEVGMAIKTTVPFREQVKDVINWGREMLEIDRGGQWMNK